MEQNTLKQQIRNLRISAIKLKKIPLIVIIGPTASGKTTLSISLAKRFSGEIVSADSRQIYRQMDIGTAKPTHKQLCEIPHHLIDIAEPDQTITLADYKKLAEQAIININSRNKLPFLVGGTGLYISAITQNYNLPNSKPNPSLRADLEKIAHNEGTAKLHRILKELDPKSARTIHPNNIRYIIRSIEIAKDLQSPKTNLKSNSPYLTLFIAINWPREELYQRINQRIDEQLEMGLINETKTLLSKYSKNLPAISSLGYREIADSLEGIISLEESIDLFKQHTRNFAKRQLTWFQKFNNVYLISGNQLSHFLA